MIIIQLDGQIVALLVQNLERLNESVKEDSDGVHNTLGKFSPHTNRSTCSQLQYHTHM